MVYVVLGMHKSGTTLVSEILHRSGIPMVELESDADYAAGNKWERASTLAFDKDLLAAHDVDSLSLAPPPAAALSGAHPLEDARRLVARIDAECAAPDRTPGEWGFKDPRACLTWPLWRRVLPAPRIIGVYRQPGAVVRHYRRHAARLHRTGPLWRLRVEWLALQRWCEYNERVLAAIEGSEGSSILLSYERLMNGDAELEQLRLFLDRALVDPRRPGKLGANTGDDRRARIGARIAQRTGAGAVLATLERLEAKRKRLYVSRKMDRA